MRSAARMPVWGSWSLFFTVSVACLLLARRLDRSPETPSREAEGAHRRANAVTLEGTAAGNLNLMPGRRIKLRGLDAEFDGTYALTAVTHVIDGESGYRTEFSTARPPRPRSHKATELTPGLVTDVADPGRRNDPLLAPAVTYLSVVPPAPPSRCADSRAATLVRMSGCSGSSFFTSMSV